MLKRITISTLALISLLICSTFAVSGYVGDAQKKDKDDKPKKQKEEKKQNAARGGDTGDVRPVLWQDPSDIESRDLFNGPGGAEGAPDANGKFTFEERAKGGTSEKIHVIDDKGRKWTVKFG